MSAGADWTTNGGATSNQRYSTLDEIDTSNVSQLKGVWRTHLNGVAMAAKYSGESQPLVQDGVIYVTRRQRRRLRRLGRQRQDPLAVQGESRPDDLDGLLRLAEPRRRTRRRPRLPGPARRQGARARPEDGRGRVDAPARAVAEGPDDHRRAALPRREDLHRRRRRRLRHARASSRRWMRRPAASEWRFYTIPAPGRARAATRGPTGDAYEQGGASVWSTPAFDKDLNLLYITTGNAGNDWYGGDRAGRQPLRRVDPGDRPRLRQAEVALPGGAPRHLGLRLAERARAVRRRATADGEGHRCAGQDRLALPARPRRRASRSTGSTRSRCRRARSRRRRRRSRSRATASSSRTRRRPPRRSRG